MAKLTFKYEPEQPRKLGVHRPTVELVYTNVPEDLTLPQLNELYAAFLCSLSYNQSTIDSCIVREYGDDSLFEGEKDD